MNQLSSHLHALGKCVSVFLRLLLLHNVYHAASHDYISQMLIFSMLILTMYVILCKLFIGIGICEVEGFHENVFRINEIKWIK